MTIEVSTNASILCGESDVFVFNTLLEGALVDDRTVSLCSAEDIQQCA
jgi:hypothetical protein